MVQIKIWVLQDKVAPVCYEIIAYGILSGLDVYKRQAMYDAANNVTGYFHLKTINDELVQKNVELELQLESIRKACLLYTSRCV